MHAPSKPDYPTITPDKMAKYDAFLFGVPPLSFPFLSQSIPMNQQLISLGIPTRFGNFPAQWRTFWDSTGQLWASGGLWGKYAGLFISTGTQGGGQESTALAAMSTLAHHGMIYVPLGAKTCARLLAELEEVRGGSSWGAGTFSGNGSRQPSEKELELARIQGEAFWKAVVKVGFE